LIYPYVSFNRERHEYTWHENPATTGKIIPSVTQIISENNLSFDFSSLPNLDLAWYGDRGTKIHKACDYIDQKRFDISTADKRIQGYLNSYKEAVDFWGFDVLESELLVWDKLGRYAGTLDRIVKVRKDSRFNKQFRENGLIAQIDIKSGSPHPSHGYQTAAYNLCLDGDWNEYSRHIPRYCLYLDQVGKVADLVAYPSLNDFVIFESALNCSIARANH
jgi:hypothetical protein